MRLFLHVANKLCYNVNATIKYLFLYFNFISDLWEGNNVFEFLKYFNLGCGLLLTVLYLHHVVYIFLGFFLHFKKDKRNNEVEKNKVAILIPARNEEVVIANLINSLKLQDYPKEFYDIYVIADNCTDNTKQVALDNGAFVIERFNKTYIGKGFALDYAIKYIKNQIKKNYDAYLVFDADNVVSHDFLSNINNEFTKGYDVVTSYRAPKNYGDNWIAAVSGLAYVRESILLQRPKSALNVNCSISGTGFLVSADVLKNGWPYHLLTEDIELSCDMSIKKYKIGYASDAVTFDEQPNKIRVFFKQRLRWSKGFLQVFRRYGFKLFKKSFKSFSAYEMFSFTLPVPAFFIFSQLVNLVCYYRRGNWKTRCSKCGCMVFIGRYCFNIYFCFY